MRKVVVVVPEYVVLEASVVVLVFGAHAYVAVFEWYPTGGMVHLHYVL